MSFIILLNAQLRKPVVTLDDVHLGRLDTINKLG